MKYLNPTVALFFGAIPVFGLTLASCSSNDNTDPIEENCTSDIVLDNSRGDCSVTLSFSNRYEETTSASLRTISANSIPDHRVGLFGRVAGALNPNAIAEQNESYNIPLQPAIADQLTPLLSTSGAGQDLGPQYAFGILSNGVELDPVAAEPFPHEGIMSPNVNWDWNLEALNVNLGLDCNNAHVQPNGKYHHHGSPLLYLESLNVSADEMTLIGYAADGFPIYYKYAYATADDANSEVVEMRPSYALKSGVRPGDGISAPCDLYNGAYSNDYAFTDGSGDLDQANGREGVTPEYPGGTYYYVLTDAFPSVPRYFRGTPSNDFRIGG